MAEIKLSFFAQALDNTSPNHLSIDGQILHSNDTALREQITTMIANTTMKGKNVFDEAFIQLHINGADFIISVPSAERDVIGRIAPIVCIGKINDPMDDSVTEQILYEINCFTAMIGRSVEPETIRVARKALLLLKKNRKIPRYGLTIGVAIIAVIAIYLLSKIGVK